MDVKLPKLGEGADSGVVVSILVKEGDRIQAGQTILELENEKAVAPIPATVGGRVTRIRVKEGDRLSVGQVVLSLADEAGAESPPAPAVEPAAPKAKGRRPQEPVPAAPEPVADEFPAKTEAEVAAPPRIRQLAKELGIDLTRVAGSERGGRIGMGDLRAYIQRLQQLVLAAKPAPGKAAPPAPEPIDFARWGPITRRPLSPLRQVISQRLTTSWTTIPHVTQFDEADVTRVLELRKQYAPAYEAQGARLTLTGFVLKAVVPTLRQHPEFNGSFDEATHDMVFKAYYHIGIAVDTDAGLIVPVIRDADQKSLLQLSRELETLAARARERKVALEELRGGSFTLSNQGGIGGGHFTPIINKPEVAILGLGRGVLRPVMRDQGVAPRVMLPLALSYDHRVIDGGSAARFVVDLVQALENFAEADVKIGLPPH